MTDPAPSPSALDLLNIARQLPVNSTARTNALLESIAVALTASAPPSPVPSKTSEPRPRTRPATEPKAPTPKEP